jgi:hypothetical protein
MHSKPDLMIELRRELIIAFKQMTFAQKFLAGP